MAVDLFKEFFMKNSLNKCLLNDATREGKESALRHLFHFVHFGVSVYELGIREIM